jgi:hypothetical protein
MRRFEYSPSSSFDYQRNFRLRLEIGATADRPIGTLHLASKPQLVKAFSKTFRGSANSINSSFETISTATSRQCVNKSRSNRIKSRGESHGSGSPRMFICSSSSVSSFFLSLREKRLARDGQDVCLELSLSIICPIRSEIDAISAHNVHFVSCWYVSHE